MVSHDRHFLNTVCTHIVDIDYGKIKMYVGNYDFWYESSQLVQAMLISNQNKRNEEKIKELQLIHRRASPPTSPRAKQATARRKLLDKLTVEEMPASSRRYPFVGFQPEREVGKDILFVTDVSQDHRRREGAGQGVLLREPGGQDRLRGRKRDGPDRPVQDPHGRAGAGRGHRQVGRSHHPQLFPQGQLPLL